MRTVNEFTAAIRNVCLITSKIFSTTIKTTFEYENGLWQKEKLQVAIVRNSALEVSVFQSGLQN